MSVNPEDLPPPIEEEDLPPPIEEEGDLPPPVEVEEDLPPPVVEEDLPPPVIEEDLPPPVIEEDLPPPTEVKPPPLPPELKALARRTKAAWFPPPSGPPPLTPEVVREERLAGEAKLEKLGMAPGAFEGPYMANTREQAMAYAEGGADWMPTGALHQEMIKSGEVDLRAALDDYSARTIGVLRGLRQSPLKVAGYSEDAKILLREQGKTPLSYVQLPNGDIVPDATDKETLEYLRKESKRLSDAAAAAGDFQRYMQLNLPPLSLSKMKWEDVFPAWSDADAQSVEQASKMRTSRMQHKKHVGTVNRTARAVAAAREAKTLDALVEQTAKLRGLERAVLEFGPSGLIVAPDAPSWWEPSMDWAAEGLAKTIFGIIASMGPQQLAKAFPEVFGWADIDPKNTYWNTIGGVGSLMGYLARTGLELPGRGAIHVGKSSFEMLQIAEQYSINDVAAMLSQAKHRVQLSVIDFMTRHPEIALETFHRADARELNYGKVLKSTLLEVPAAAVIPVHLTRGVGQIIKFWADPELSTDQKLRGAGEFMGEVADAVGHRYKSWVTKPEEVFEEGMFKVFLDIFLFADIAAFPARMMARQALATARRTAQRELYAAREPVERAEFALREAKRASTGAFVRVKAVEEAEAALAKAVAESKKIGHRARVRGERADDIIFEERVHLHESEKNLARGLAEDYREAGETIKLVGEVLGGSMENLNKILPKELRGLKARLDAYERSGGKYKPVKDPKTGAAVSAEVDVSKMSLDRLGHQVVDPELTAAWKVTKRKISYHKKKGNKKRVAELEDELRNIRGRQHMIDGARMPEIEQQISNLTRLIEGGPAAKGAAWFTIRGGAKRQPGLIELRDAQIRFRKSRVMMSKLIQRNKRRAPKEAGIPKESTKLAHDAVVLAEFAERVQRAGLYLLPIVGQAALVNRTIHLALEGPGAIGIPGFGRIPKAKLRAWWQDRNNRLPESWQSALREADGAAGEFVYRVAERLRAMDKDDMPMLRDLLKFEHDEITRNFLRDPHAPAGKKYSLKNEPSWGGKKPPLGEAEPWQMTKEEFAMGGRDPQAVPFADKAMGRRRVMRTLEAHREHIEAAIAEGKAIPWEVLQGHPDLLRKLTVERAQLERRLAVMNKHDDIVDFLLETNKKAREARALYDPGKARPVYYPEVIEQTFDTMNQRLNYFKEWVANPRLEEAASEIAALGARFEDQAVGLAIMENTWRRMGFTAAEREAGYVTKLGKRVRVVSNINDELLVKLPMAVRDFEFLKAFNKMRTDVSVHRPFANADRVSVLQDQIYAVIGSRKMSAKQKGVSKEQIRKRVKQKDVLLKKLRKQLKDLEDIGANPMSVRQAEREILAVQRNKRMKPAKKRKKIEELETKLHDAHIRETLRKEGWIEIGPDLERTATFNKNAGDSIVDGQFIVSRKGKLKGVINRRIQGSAAYEMGNLRGMLNSDVAYELYGAKRFSKEYGAVQGNLLSFFKATKTILSLGTHVTNFLGNFLYLAPLAGLSPWNPQNWKYFLQAGKDFAGRTKSPQYLRWVKAGGRGPAGGINRSEMIASADRGVGMLYQGVFGNIARAHNNMAKMVKGTFLGDPAMFLAGGKGMAQHLKTIPKDMYGSGDDIFRAATFYKEIDIRGAWNRADKLIDANAALKGRHSYADYENLNGIFQVMRKAWWGQVWWAFDARMTDKFILSMQARPYMTQFSLALHDHMSTQNMVDAGFDPHLADMALESVPDYAKFSRVWLLSVFPELKGTDIEGLRVNFLKYVPSGRRLPMPHESVLQWLGRAFASDNPFLATYMHTQNVDPFYRGSIYKEGIGGDSPDVAIDRILERIRMTWLMPDTFGLGYGYREVRMEKARRGEIPYGHLQPRSVLKEGLGRWAGLDVGVWSIEKIVSAGDLATAAEVRKLKGRWRSIVRKVQRNQLTGVLLDDAVHHWALQWREAVERIKRRSKLREHLEEKYPESVIIPVMPEISKEDMGTLKKAMTRIEED